jgi:hypothetical protein
MKNANECEYMLEEKKKPRKEKRKRELFVLFLFLLGQFLWHLFQERTQQHMKNMLTAHIYLTTKILLSITTPTISLL